MKKIVRISGKGDANQIAHRMIQEVIAMTEGPAQSPPASPPQPAKNPAAVALGRLGGLRGGKARAESLSKKRRASIAKKAAETRWKKKK